MKHRWEEIRDMPTCFVTEGGAKCHESVLRAFQALEQVRQMLVREDSAETIREFICFVSQSNGTPDYVSPRSLEGR